MAYVSVPKDLTRVKTKVLFNLTKRQLICFGLAILVGGPFYYLTRGALGITISAGLMVLIVLPFFLMALYEKDGMPPEEIIAHYIELHFKRPMVRPYQTVNLYAYIQEQIKEKEDSESFETDRNHKGKSQEAGHLGRRKDAHR